MKRFQLSLIILFCVALSGCASSAAIKQQAARIDAPHPDGVEMSDLKALFLDRKAPALSSLEQCDFDYLAEKRLARTKEELFMAFPAHVQSRPEFYHWCFYSKLLKLRELTPEDGKLSEKQKMVLDNYVFLAHLARVFQADFDDVRYLRFAVLNYQRLSEALFLQPVNPDNSTQIELLLPDEGIH